jgi:MFS family permease
VVVRVPKISKNVAGTGSYWREMRAGLRFIAGDALILAIVIVVMLTNFLDSIFGGVVQPVYVKQVFGEALNLGLLIAANGAGAVVGGLIFAAIGPRLPRHAVFVGAFVLTGLRFWFFLLQPPLPLLLAAVFFTSLGAGPLNPIIAAVEFERIPVDMRGRVFGAIHAGAWIAMPLGMLLGGFLTESLGVSAILIGLGIVYAAVTLGMAFVPAIRQMSHKPQQPDPKGI